MDTRLRELERRALTGDPEAKRMYKTQLVRMSTFVPHPNINRRTLKRWRAHINLKCNDRCRFCRRAVAK